MIQLSSCILAVLLVILIYYSYYMLFYLKLIIGPPKGVSMSHENVMSSMLGYSNVATIFENDVYMAYLPLAHVLELIAG